MATANLTKPCDVFPRLADAYGALAELLAAQDPHSHALTLLELLNENFRQALDELSSRDLLS